MLLIHKLKFFVTAFAVTIGFSAFSMPFFHSNELAKTNNPIKPATQVAPDNRRIRGVDSGLGIWEGSQGRIWCFPRTIKAEHINLKLLKNQPHFYVANAQLIGRKDIIVFSRHMLIEKSGKQINKPEKCYFEHISSGEIIRLTGNIKYRSLSESYPKSDARPRNDYVFSQLSEPVKKYAYPIPRSDIVIDVHLPTGAPLTVVSNYAENFIPKDALTITECYYLATTTNDEGEDISEAATDCVVGPGTSGSGVFINWNKDKKLYGLATSEKQFTYIEHFTSEFMKLFDEFITEFNLPIDKKTPHIEPQKSPPFTF